MVHIIGIGGVGFWLTVGLAKSLPPADLHCWDTDNLDGGTGSTRLPWAPAATLKTDLLKGYLTMVLALDMLPTMHNERFTGNQPVAKGDVVVDCTDMTLVSRKQMWGKVRKKGGKLLRVSYDGQGSILIASTGLPLYAPGEGGYSNVPTLALSLAAGGVGAEVVRRYVDKPVDSFTFSLSIKDVMYPEERLL